MAFPTKILLGTDGSKDADLAAHANIDLADQYGAELHVVQVGEAPPYPAPDHYEVVVRQRSTSWGRGKGRR